MQIDSRVAPPTLLQTRAVRPQARTMAAALWKLAVPSAATAATPAPGAQPPTPAATQRFARLNRLAQALGRDFQVRLRAGTSWGYLPRERLITCPPQSLAEHTDGYTMGRVCRELARMRYSGAAPAGAESQPIVHYLWQLEESLRASRLMAARYAGVRSLLAEVTSTDRPMGDEVPPLVQWGESCLAAWGGDPRRAPSPQAQAAMQALWPLLDEITAPPTHLDLRFDDLTATEAHAATDRARRAVVDRLLPEVLKYLQPLQNPGDGPTAGAQHADDAATPAELAAAQAADPEMAPANDEPSHAANSAGATSPGPPSQTPAADAQALANAIARLLPKLPFETHETAETADTTETAATAATAAAARMQAPAPGPAQPAGPTPNASAAGNEGHVYTDAPTPTEAVDLESQLQALRVPTSYYEELCSAHTHDIDAMEHELEEAFELRRRPKPQGYYTSGQFHLPRAMQAAFRREATGVSQTRLYRRKSPPNQRSVGFVLVLDRSGSMQGERIVNLQRAAAMLLEPARRLQMDLGIVSYGSRAQLLKSPTDDLSPAACNHLMDQLIPHGNNNEQAALAASAAMAGDMTADEVFILFVTDGGGDPRITQQIAMLEHQHPTIKVVGVGIGPGCEEVPRLYPRHLGVPDVSALPQSLAELFVGLQTQPAEEA